ncbi:hypothetical protein B0H19DRAFT_1272649 [Mycena capillaripes]|nr:hypothetical protein B0H19DRAFT_1272649 [Mycena capillaripes]
MPGICIFMGYDPSRMDYSPLFLTREAAVEYLTKGAMIWTYFIHWLACAMIHSHKIGFNSQLNFGAPIGMQDTEFLHRVSQYAFYGSAQSLRSLMSHTVYANSMDFMCAEFISKFARRIPLTANNGNVHMCVWPLPAADPGHRSVCRDEVAELYVRMYLDARGLSIADLDAAVIATEESYSSIYDIMV